MKASAFCDFVCFVFVSDGQGVLLKKHLCTPKTLQGIDGIGFIRCFVFCIVQ